MIQRVQTIWLLLASAAGFLTTEVPLYAGTLAGEVVRKYTATQNLLLFSDDIVAAVVALIAIFLYKNRGSQMKLTAIGILASIIMIALEVWQAGEFERSGDIVNSSISPLNYHYYWGALLPVAMTIFFILAAVNIRKDNKLVKSLDQLR